MSDSIIIELKDIHSDDISEMLVRVEKSFGFKFGRTELKDVRTFGELCDTIIDKVQGDSSYDCTTQQAFYKIRAAISDTLLVDKNSIEPDSDLQQLFPRKDRRQKITATETSLGFKMKTLRPKHWVAGTLFLILFASLVGFFIFWKIALAILISTIIGISLAYKFGNEFDLETVGQLAEKISRENYLKSRRNSGTINKKEIVQKVKELFSEGLDVNENALTKEATFI